MDPETRRQFTRMDNHRIVRFDKPSKEDGWTSWSREVAEAVCATLRGSNWRAEARAPYWPHSENETHGQLLIAVDRRWLVVHTHTVPTGTSRDLFTLAINGRRVSYPLYRRQLPHDPATIAGNVWRHVNGATAAECDALMCRQTPTVATYGSALCEAHAREYVENGRW
jgi:hypothetical protein